jgi:hypothetical protein
MATIIHLSDYRPPTRIPPVVQQGYDDVRVEFARRVEERAAAMWARQIAGECPADTEQK